MKRALLISASILLLLLVLLLGWLASTESGLRWAYHRAAPWLPEELTVAEISGRLAGPVRVQGAAYRQQGLIVKVGELELDWNPWALFALAFEVTSLSADSLSIELADAPAAATTAATATPPQLPLVELPLAILLDRAQIDDIEIRRGASAYRLSRIELQGGAQYNRFEIGKLLIETDDFTLRVDGKITAREAYPHELGFAWQGKLPTGEELNGKGRIAGDSTAMRLDQQVAGKLEFEHWLELSDPLASLQWRTAIDVANFDSRLIDPSLPAVEGRLQANAEGDLESYAANGRLEAAAPRVGDFIASFRLRSLDGERRFDGLQIDNLTLSTAAGEIRSRGLAEWLPVPRWDLQVSASSIDPAAVFAEWPGMLNAEFSTDGSFAEQRLQAHVAIAELQGRLRDYPLGVRGDLRWNDGEIAIDGVEVVSGDSRIRASGQAADKLDIKWSLASTDLGEIYPGLAGSLQADGKLDGSRDAPQVAAKFRGQVLAWGEYRLGQASGEISLNPLQLDRYEVRIEAGDIQIHEQRLQSADIVADPQRVELRMKADEASVSVALEGSLEGRQWRGKLVEAKLDSRDFDNWSLLEAAPLELSAERVFASNICLQNPRQSRLCGSVDQLPDRWKISLDIARLPLAMFTRFTPPRLQADGLADAQAELAYTPETNRLLGNARVQLGEGRAQIPLTAEKTLPLNYRSASLDLQFKPDAIDAGATLEFVNGDRLQTSARLPGAGLTDTDLTASNLEARLRGQLSDFAIVSELSPQIESLAGLLELDLAFSGQFSEPRIGGEARLRNASLQVAEPGLLLDSIDLLLQGDDLGGVAYRATARLGSGEIEFDGNTRLDAGAGWPSEIRINARDLAAAELLEQRLPLDIDIDGQFDAAAELRFKAPAGLKGNLGLVSTQGSLHYPLLDSEIEHWEYHDARLEVVLSDHEIRAETRVTFGDDNLLQAGLVLPNASLLTLDPATQAVSANAQIEFRQIEILQLLIPDIDNPRGRLKLDADAGGTLASPRITARAELVDGAVDIPRLGLKIDPVRLTGNSNADGHFKFILEARSGDGNLRISGDSLLDAARGWPTRIEISGENFVAARIPEASVDLSPALVVEIEHRNISISGDLHVPFARLQPRDVSTAQRVSSDTVVIGGDRPAEPGWSVTTSVNLTLGERVAFYGYGFDGRLSGRLLIEQQPGQPTSGTGEITVPSGRYRAYGQRLDIENGRVLFTGGPLTNPGLDIRATRDSNGIITGLLVRGRLQRPQIELFSIPAMGQTETLSYLLFGRPLETASGEDSASMAQAALALGLAGGDQIARSLRERFGLDEFHVEAGDSGDQASLVVGRYLSPDFYVSYAVGLIESVNSVTLRYRITESWQLEAESGLHQGADLLYTIER